jgi:hypothetical protein
MSAYCTSQTDGFVGHKTNKGEAFGIRYFEGINCQSNTALVGVVTNKPTSGDYQRAIV